MWICTDNGNTAYNLDHVTRLFVEETGTGAALKAEINGKIFMVAYYSSKPEAKTMLNNVMEKRDSGAAVIRI